MTNLLYIGNKLSQKGKNPTGIEVLGPLLASGGYRLRYASSQSGKFPRLASMLWHVLRFGRWADAVLIDTYSTSNFWYAVLVSQLCRLIQIPYIPILHGGNLPKRLVSNPVLCRMLFANARVCVAPSRYLQEAFSRKGFDVLHIPNPVDVRQFPHKIRLSVRPALIWVRSLSSLYNPMMALMTLKELRVNFPDASLVMVGPDGGLLAELESFAAVNELNVIFTGRLAKAEWARLAINCDVFLNTSTVDNAPFSIIEALSLGLYVVSTDVGGIPFLVRDNREALLVGSGNYQGMERAINQVLTSETLRETLSENASALVSASSSVAVLSRWNEILR